jgi:serine O-acetyltransferase
MGYTVEAIKSLAAYKLKEESEKNLDLQFIPMDKIQNFISLGLNLLFPGQVRQIYKSEEDIKKDVEQLKKLLSDLLSHIPLSENQNKNDIVETFLSHFPKLIPLIASDMEAAFQGDPAASSLREVIHCYPGPFAIAIYRMAHELYLQDIPLIPRIMTELAHQKTGIDIHPGAQINGHFFIDHGTGVVIGETCVIGENVKIYQGVTLGALSVEKNMAKKKRHPTIEEGCVIYAHATILGGDTVIGKESIIGGNVWLTRSISAHSLVYHKSEIKHDFKEGFKEAQELIYEI